MASGRPSGPFGSQVVANTTEIKRIAALPRRQWSDADASALAQALTKELRRPGGTMALRPVQAIALYEAMETGGLFGPIRVGGGKTLISLLLGFVLEARWPILLLPASLIEKTEKARKELSKHWYLPTNLQMISFEQMGRVKAAEQLDYIRPDLIIADECHRLKNRRASVTRRVVRYMREHPDARFVGISGTVMKASIADFSHILRWCLKNNAPIPHNDEEVTNWAEAIDEKVNPMNRRRPGALFNLGPKPGGVDELAAARQVFQSRLLETQGVVASSKTDGVTCSIRVQALEYQLSSITEGHFHTLRTLWETPCGKAFSEATEFRMYARELGLGFSYTWVAREKASEWAGLLRQSKKQNVPRGNGSIVSSTRTEPRTLGRDTGGNTLSPPSCERNGERTIRNGENTSSSTPRNTELDPRYAAEEKSTMPHTISRTIVPGRILQNSSPPDPKPTSVGERKIKTSSQLLRRLGQKPRSGEPLSSTMSASTDTGSLPRSIEDSSSDAEIVARSAERKCGMVEAGELSTTNTELEEFGGFFAQDATELSGCSEIELGLSGPMLTFLEQNRAPPEWLNARRAWCSFVREQIGHSQKYDSMLQVANACDDGLLSSDALNEWRRLEPTYKPLTRAVFHDTSAIEACVSWMHREKGIVWVEHRAFGEALSRLTGSPYFGAKGLDSDGNLVENVKPGRAIICSIAACGQGFNLQMFSKALITSCPSGAATMEQVLGRIHRDGQEADEVVVDVLLGCSEHAEAFERALDGAKAAADTLGHSQKLCLADIIFERPNKKGPLWA